MSDEEDEGLELPEPIPKSAEALRLSAVNHIILSKLCWFVEGHANVNDSLLQAINVLQEFTTCQRLTIEITNFKKF